jgi:hypothetical protein
MDEPPPQPWRIPLGYWIVMFLLVFGALGAFAAFILWLGLEAWSEW